MQGSRYCSWCYTRTDHVLHERRRVGRDTYVCQSCKGYTVPCRYCDHMAQGGLNAAQLDRLQGKFTRLFKDWHNELCSEHDGTIGSFERLDTRIPDLHLYGDLFRRDAVNVAKVGKYGAHIGFWSSFALLMAGTGGSAAPVGAAALRAGLFGAGSAGVALAAKGAALSSASIAIIGAGAAGGGLPVIAAAGLGGWQGGVIANRYHADDPAFAVTLLADEESTSRTMFINGFLQQEETRFADWRSGHVEVSPGTRCYGVTWTSKTPRDVAALFGLSGESLAGKFLGSPLRRLPRLSSLNSLANVVANPWHVAMSRAGQTGVLLAEILSRDDGPPVTLAGHSLGCRVIYYALEALGKKAGKRVADVILLGGAVGNDSADWRRASQAVAGTIFNCYSKKDSVLEWLYTNANMRVSDPIGFSPIGLDDARIRNIDCTDFVDGHMNWKAHYGAILRMTRERGSSTGDMVPA